MLFLNVSGMHHRKGTSIMFHCSVCMSVCWCGNALNRSTTPPPSVLLLTHCYTAPESAACPHYSHTHLPLLVPPQHLEPEEAAPDTPGLNQGVLVLPTHMPTYSRNKAVTVNELSDWLDDRKIII